MVEFAITVPLMALLVFGLVEIGWAWRDTLTVETAARSGVRIASNLGDERLSDWAALSAVRAGLGDIDNSNIIAVIIYKPEADGSIPATCLTSAPSSVTGLCNYYDNADVFGLGEVDFTTAGTACGSTAPDRFWCPLDRSTTQGALDHVGVYIEVEYDSKTDILPFASLSIDDSAVMRIEPRLETSL